MITLNDAEQRLATYIAKGRYNNARDNGVIDGKMGDQSNWQTDLEGIAAEIAFCRHMNLYPDLKIDTPDNLPVHDAISHKGALIDVKSTQYPNGRLLAVLGKANKRCDVYALVTGTFPTYRIVGWVTQGELFNDENIIDLGHGKGYALEQSRLRSF